MLGAWVGATPESEARGSLSDELLKGILGLAGDGATIEFSNTGRYKMSFHIVSLTGRWTMSGDVVVLTPEPGDSNQTGARVSQERPIKLRLSQDGSTLSSIKEFESDPQIVFKRRQSRSN